jgi:hypothetical protein
VHVEGLATDAKLLAKFILFDSESVGVGGFALVVEHFEKLD